MDTPYDIKKEGRLYVAYKGKRVVGKAAPWEDSLGNWTMQNVVVNKNYRRKGVGTALYSHIEKESGRHLKPAISLSDDAFHFWNKYRPEEVKDDLRHRKDELMGQHMVSHRGPGKVISVNSHSVTIEHEDGKQSFITAKNLSGQKTFNQFVKGV